MRIRIAAPVAAAVAVLALTAGVPTMAQADPVQQPCPTIIQIGGTVTVVCDDGTAQFNLTAMEDRVTYSSPVMAGSHTLRAVIKVGDEFRVWYDEPKVVTEGDGTVSSYARVTILDMVTDVTTALGY